ncbi:MAG: ribonuclease P protein component [Candidatus Babeliales bacterium]
MATAHQRHTTHIARIDVIRLLKSTRPLHRQAEIEIKAAQTKHERPFLLIVIPRAVGNAVQRNKIRRRLKALMLRHGHLVAEKDILIFVRPGAALFSFDALETIVQQAFTPKRS